MLVILRSKLVKKGPWLLIARQRLLLNGFIDKRGNYTHLSR